MVKKSAALAKGVTGQQALRLLSKAEVCQTVGVSFPTIWVWMRAGSFPRSRIVGGKSMWRSDEIAQWLDDLQVRPLKGDAPDREGVEAAREWRNGGQETPAAMIEQAAFQRQLARRAKRSIGGEGNCGGGNAVI